LANAQQEEAMMDRDPYDGTTLEESEEVTETNPIQKRKGEKAREPDDPKGSERPLQGGDMFGRGRS
jgi:hypothetical protein